MRKIPLYILIISTLFFNVSIVHANTQTPAANISVGPSSFINCLNSLDTNVQVSLQQIDNCFGNVPLNLTFIDSLVKSGNNVSLVNDSVSPGNSLYYGTNGSGTKGFYTIPVSGITALTGDVSATGPGSATATLATVNTNVGSFGSSTAIPNFTVNGKGLLTAAGSNAVVAPAGTLTGTALASNVVSSSLTSVGTIGTGIWHGTAIGYQYGGSGQITAPSNDLLVGNGSGWTLTTLGSCSGATNALTYNMGTGLFGCNSIVGGVSSVSNSDSSLSISPTTGTVVASLNTGHSNTWSASQIFNSNVGINSANPGQALDIQGTVRALNFSGPGTGLTGTASSLTAGTVSTISGLVAGGTNVTITGSGTSGSPYTINSSGSGGGSNGWSQAGNNVYTTSNSYNVGIGTMTPGQALDVKGTVRVSGSVNTPALSNLTTNGFVKTSGGIGTLSIDTSTYLTTASATSLYVPFIGCPEPVNFNAQTLFNIGTLETDLSTLDDGSGNASIYNELTVNSAHGNLLPAFQVLDSFGNQAFVVDNQDFYGYGDRVATFMNILDDGTGYMTVNNGLTLNNITGPAGSDTYFVLNMTGGNAEALFNTVSGDSAEIVFSRSDGQNPPPSTAPNALWSMGINPNGFGDNRYTFFDQVSGQSVITLDSDTGDFKTLNNTVDDGTGASTFNGTLTASNIIDSGLSASTIVYANGSKQLSSATIGSGLSFTSGTLSATALSSPWGNSGSNVYLLTSTNNVGIGSSTPGSKLDVQGTVRILNGNVGIGSTAPGQALDVQGTVRVLGSGTLSVAGTSTLTGNVGIGQAPDGVHTLIVGSKTGVSSPQNSDGLYVIPNAANVELAVSNSTGHNIFSAIESGGAYFGTGSNDDLIIRANNGDGSRLQASTKNWTFGGSGSPGSTVSSEGNLSIGSSYYTTAAPSNGAIIQGNVGIGSTTPGQALDVQGTVRDLGEVLTSNVPSTTTNTLYNNSGTLYFNGSAVGGSSGLWTTVNTNDVYEQNGSTYGNVGIGTNLTSNAALTVMNGNVGIGTWKPNGALMIQSGNVGIDTFTASNNLTVNGNIQMVGSQPNLLIPAAGFIEFNNSRTIQINNASSDIYAGILSGPTSTDGGDNSSLGTNTLASLTSSGANDAAIGNSALNGDTSGSQNTAAGTLSLRYLTTTNLNAALGYNAGTFITGGSTHITTAANSVFVGASTEALADGDTNETVVGYNAIGAGSNSVVLGNSSVTTTELQGNIGLGTSVPTSKIQVKGTCASIGPVGACWTSTGQMGYCSGAANVCTTCTAC
jgi:hypothetical protein